MTEKLLNGQLLEAVQTKLTDAMKQKNLSKKDRLQYEILELIVMFIAEDHPKTRKMYSVFIPLAWGGLIAGGIYIADIAKDLIILLK